MDPSGNHSRGSRLLVVDDIEEMIAILSLKKGG